MIRTTHVGSLPRSAAVAELLFAAERGEPVDAARFDTEIAVAVDDAVARQRGVGIDIVSDGEMSKISYATYIKDRITGFAKPQGLLFQTANPRHQHDIEAFVDLFCADRVIAGTDCGFSTFAGFGAVDPAIVYAKRAALAEGAAMAGRERAA